MCKLIMSNSEGNLGQQGPSGEEGGKGVSRHKPQDHYEKLMNEGKSVLDSIHLHNAPNQGTFEPQRTTPHSAVVLTLHLPDGEQKMLNEEEEGQLGGDLDSRNEGELSSRNDTEHRINMEKKSSRAFVGCNCIKSKCTKNYCECFVQARKCSEFCKCTGCENQGEVEKWYRNNGEADEGEKVCNCKKSSCLKKYCECYNNGQKCSSSCKCEECRNGEEHEDKDWAEEARPEPRKSRSPEELEEINSKIDELAKLVPLDHQEYFLSFLEYWLS